MDVNKIFQHNVLDPWPLPDKSVNCIVTSPPYWNLRNYKVDGQIGLEKTPAEYIDKMVRVFSEARRALKDDGTLWVNIGDCYASKAAEGMKAKDLVGIPWMLAFALRADGWYLRQDIVWHKPNPMPESATDRCTRAHEYLFMFSKKAKYYYDAYAIRTPLKDKTFTAFGIESTGHGDGSGLVQSENWAKDVQVRQPKQWKMPDGWATHEGGHGSFHKDGREKGKIKVDQSPDTKSASNLAKFRDKQRHAGLNDRWDQMSVEEQRRMGANKRSVWKVATAGFKEAHFATFPEELIIDPILAGCPPGGLVLDPFFGSGTAGLVALKLGRNFLGFEISPEYIKIAERRLRGVQLGSGII